MKPNVRARGYFLHVRVLGEIDRRTCRFSDPNIGCGKSIVKSSLKPLYGSKRAHLSPSRHLDRRAGCAGSASATACSTMPADCSRKTNGPGAAVHDRNLRTGDVDVQVVDAESGERRHQVLDRGNRGAVLLRASTTAACRRRCSASAGMATGCARSTRWNTMPVSGGAGRKHDLDARPGVQADARRLDRAS